MYSESIKDRKAELRLQMKTLRSEIDSQWKTAYDKAVCDVLLSIIEHGSFQLIHAYLPMRGEIDIFPLIKTLLARGISIIVPKTLPGGKMEHLLLGSDSLLEKGVYGTLKPVEEVIYEGPVEMIIVPGLAFSKDGIRLGYGGGYYDQFLTSQANSLKIGVCYPFQLIEHVPSEDHDVRVDKVVVNPFYSL